jgi:hypothetical protein
VKVCRSPGIGFGRLPSLFQNAQREFATVSTAGSANLPELWRNKFLEKVLPANDCRTWNSFPLSDHLDLTGQDVRAVSRARIRLYMKAGKLTTDNGFDDQ